MLYSGCTIKLILTLFTIISYDASIVIANASSSVVRNYDASVVIYDRNRVIVQASGNVVMGPKGLRREYPRSGRVKCDAGSMLGKVSSFYH